MPKGTLYVNLLAGCNLPDFDLPTGGSDKSDVYIIFWIIVNGQWKRVQKSTTKDNTTDPIWNEDFYFYIDTTGADAFYVQIWDKDTPASDQLINGFAVPSAAFPPPRVEQLRSFNVGAAGKLFLKLKFFPDMVV